MILTDIAAFLMIDFNKATRV